VLTVVRASPAAETRSALLTAAPEATSLASVLSVIALFIAESIRPDAAGGTGALSRSSGSGDGSSIGASWRG